MYHTAFFWHRWVCPPIVHMCDHCYICHCATCGHYKYFINLPPPHYDVAMLSVDQLLHLSTHPKPSYLTTEPQTYPSTSVLAAQHLKTLRHHARSNNVPLGKASFMYFNGTTFTDANSP